MAHFTLENLTFAYPTSDKQALSDINLSIEKGQYVTLCGKSGSGKSTLMRHLKSVLTPHGDRSGRVLFEGRELSTVDMREQSSKIGFVMQNPDNQIVTDKVWHELAFGLESLGCDQKVMRLRVAEMASYFGIQKWFHKSVSELSGGQKQLLNLASIMAMQPSVLILDEPTSQLDPIAATDFLNTVRKINLELGTTIIISEHRLEDVFSVADRLIVMDQGRIIADDNPRRIGEHLKDSNDDMFAALPSPVQIYYGSKSNSECPLTVREGRNWLTSEFEGKELKRTSIEESPELPEVEDPAIELREVWFRYAKDAPDVVKGASFEVERGTLFAIVGGNGTGKSTTLKSICNICKPYRGKVLIDGKPIDKYKSNELFRGNLAMLPQDPQSLFVKKTLRDELFEMVDHIKSDEEKASAVDMVAKLCEVDMYMDSHPYDLSGGEQQRAALAKVLLCNPKILLLDEPTKGIDNFFKIKLAKIFRTLCEQGVTIVMASHDVEFCARYADSVSMFFDGGIVTTNTPSRFFSQNCFYTTAANRMSRHMFQNAITNEDVIELCQIKESTGSLNALSALYMAEEAAKAVEEVAEEQPAVEAAQKVEFETEATPVPAPESIPSAPASTEITGEIAEQRAARLTKSGRKRLTKRTIVSIIAILVLIPPTIFIGWNFGDRNYYITSVLIIAYTLIPFFISFENRKPQARELVIIAVMIAIAVVSRVAFIWAPSFKPTIAVIMIAGMALGAEAGFMTGSLTAFVSNFIFGQGPWTPFQMFAYGIAGLVGGILAHKGILKTKPVHLIISGIVVPLCIVGPLLDTCALFLSLSEITWESAGAIYLSGLPVNAALALATTVTLLLAAKPLCEKLDRVKVKYGFMEGE